MPSDFDDKGRKGGKSLSAEDLKLWKQFTHDIDPLHDVDWDGLEALAASRDDVKDKMRGGIMDARREVPVMLPGPAARQSAGMELDRRTEEKLRRGQMEIDARIDLHGYTQDRAQDSLLRFIDTQYRRGARCVLVITGKGRSSNENDEWTFNDGILRARVPEWLSSPPLGDAVLRCVQAQPKDGGEGAYYVYLRRQRE